jgi:hypothetical protein
MESNIAILLALVHYIHRCDPSRSTEVAHQMERDALALRRALIALGLNMLGMKSAVNGPACVNEAASSYYLMKERVMLVKDSSDGTRVIDADPTPTDIQRLVDLGLRMD